MESVRLAPPWKHDSSHHPNNGRRGGGKIYRGRLLGCFTLAHNRLFSCDRPLVSVLAHQPTFIMPYDGNGNYVESCGDMCISNRFAKDSSNGAKVEAKPAPLCGFGCGGYGNPNRGGMCARCIKERNMEDVFPELMDGSDSNKG